MIRLLAALGWFAAAGLAVAGSLVKISGWTDGQLTFSSSTWTMTFGPITQADLPSPLQGIGLAVAAALLVVAAVLRLWRARVQVSRLIGIYGTAVLCAMTVGMLDLFQVLVPPTETPSGLVVQNGPAAWYLIGASVLAIAAVGTSLVPRTEQSG